LQQPEKPISPGQLGRERQQTDVGKSLWRESIQQNRTVKLRAGIKRRGDYEIDYSTNGPVGADARPVHQVRRNFNAISVSVKSAKLDDRLAIGERSRADGIHTQQLQKLDGNCLVSRIADAICHLNTGTDI
jgi:hypothetical protein